MTGKVKHSKDNHITLTGFENVIGMERKTRQSNPAFQYLMQKQALPLEAKIMMSKQRIREWYEHWKGQVYVSFSGGKDSTVLLHLVRSIYPKVVAVFFDTGLEYPEIKEFVRGTDNVQIVRPKMTFQQVIEKYGYPVISKEASKYIYEIRNTKSEYQRNRNLYGNSNGHFGLNKKYHYLIEAPFVISDKCCAALKKRPAIKFEKESELKSYIGMMAEDSMRRMVLFANNGCNAFNAGRPTSNPLSFWLEEDVWQYIQTFGVPYSKIYDMGEPRTGCMFCMFGVHMEKQPNKFQRMQLSHPQLHDYCINKLGLKTVLDYIGVPYDNRKEQQMLWEEEIP